MLLCFWKRGVSDHDIVEAVNEARLENADRDLAHLRKRADLALGTLEDRHSRNHWRESIEQMITGGI